MFEIAERLLRVLDAGRPLAVATAVSIEGSAPRTVGTSMAWDGTEVIGSIAGGCVEGAVVEVAGEVLAHGHPVTVEYGVSDETAFSVGLTCGGQLRIHVERVLPGDPVVDELRAAAAGDPAGRMLDLTPRSTGAAPADVHARLRAELAARVAVGSSALTTVDCDGAAVEAFFEVATPPARLVIIGAMEFSAALAAAAHLLGYRVTVCDPRALFATVSRFPSTDVVVDWPPRWLATQSLTARDAVCVLSHDSRFDASVIAVALDSGAGYVGAMGSRRTHDRRVASLAELGVVDVSRLRSPIGLDLGASTPEETAVSILAEIIAARTGAPGLPLRETAGTIHPTAATRLEALR